MSLSKVFKDGITLITTSSPILISSAMSNAKSSSLKLIVKVSLTSQIPTVALIKYSLGNKLRTIMLPVPLINSIG